MRFPTARHRASALLAPLAFVGLGAAAAPSASAGTYQVRACFGAENNAWQTYVSHGSAAAYVSCPAGDGLIARNTVVATPAPLFANGRVFFDAPAGAQVAGLSVEAQVNTGGNWQAGVHDDTHNQWLWCGSGCFSGTAWVAVNLSGLSTSRIQALLICGANSCAADGGWGRIALRNAVVTVADSTAPSLRIVGGTFVHDGWHGAREDIQFRAEDNVGVRTIQTLIDGRSASSADRPCDDTRIVPCPNGLATTPFDSHGLADGRHEFALRAVDSAGNFTDVAQSILIDNTAPEPPRRFGLSDGEGWRATNRFTVRWRNPVQDAAAIVAVHYELCRTDAAQKRECLRGEQRGRDLEAADLQVPAAGDWDLRAWLEDEAGNTDDRASAGPVHLRLDTDQPDLAIVPLDPNQPSLVLVRASDATSGIAAGEIKVRPRGATSWRSLPVTLISDGFFADVDDADLPDGTYEIQARAIDAAGNNRATDRGPEGGPAQLTLPRRAKSRLRVGRPRRVHRRVRGRIVTRVKLVANPKVHFGRRVRLVGRLTTPGQNPVANSEVQVFVREDRARAPFRAIGSIMTSASGRLSFIVPPGQSRVMRFRYPGTATVRSRSADVEIRVGALSSMRVSRSRVSNGEAVTFRGRVRTGPLPETGKLIALQVLVRRNWRTFATVRANPSGQWRRRYRFQATTGIVSYRFRALIPREAGYPYATGVSGTARVTVRGS